MITKKLCYLLLMLIIFVISFVFRTSITNETVDYDNNSFILQDVELEEVKQLTKHYNASYSNLDDSKTSIIYLNDDLDVDDVFDDDFFESYRDNAFKNYYATFFDGDDYYSKPNTTLNTEQFYQQEYLNYINLGDIATHKTSRKARIALIDTGIDLSHPDLSKVSISKDSYNVSLNKKVYEDGKYDYSIINDDFGHGTNVAGVIAGSGNILGINSNVELIIVKVTPERDGAGRLLVSNDQLIKALDYISTFRVDIVNMSWGIYADKNPFEKQIEKIIKKGTVCVASAGNDRTNKISYPAADDNVVAVGAYDYETKQLADYSNYGDDIDIVAPGKVYTTDLYGKYKSVTGTSYASAIVAAALSHLGNYINMYDSILSSGSIDLGEKGKDLYYGNGLIDISKIVYSEKSEITFDMLCEEVKPLSMKYVDGGILQSFPIPERIYDYFAGWYYDANLTKKVNYYYDSFSGDITLYAKWVSNSYLGESLFTYEEVENDKVEITGYTGNRKKIAIPQIIDSKTVIGIADKAFYNSNLEIVELPKTLRYIGKSAFSRSTSLREIIIPDSVKLINKYAFSDCGSLANVSISDNSQLEEILDYAFYNTNIKSIYIPSRVFEIGVLALSSNSINTIEVHKNNLSYISYDNVLYNKIMDKLIYYPMDKIGSFTVPSTVRTISSYAFYRSSLENVNLNNVEIIERSGFELSSIKDIQIPATVKSLGDYVFAQTSIDEIKILEGVKRIPEFTFKSAYISNISLPKSLETIEGGAFYQAQIGDFLLPTDGNLTNILSYYSSSEYYGSFENSTISSFVGPSSLLFIDEDCFRNCSSLTSVDLSQTQIKKIPAFAFYSSGLSTLNLPDTVTSIEEYSFANANLSSLHLGSKVSKIGTGFLLGNICTDFTIDHNNPYFEIDNLILYNKGKTIIHSYHGEDSQIVIPSTVEVIKDAAFSQKDNLTEIVFEEGSSLTHIGNEAFSFTGLTSFYFSDKITYIGESAFEWCEKLNNITFSENIRLKEINERMFLNCSLYNVVIPESIEIIDKHAFANNKISQLNLGENVVLIEEGAFSGNYISSLVLNEGLRYIGNSSFDGHKLFSLNIPSTVEEIGNCAFRGNVISKITFSDDCNIKILGDLAFGELSISDLIVPASVEKIGQATFNGVGKLYFAENSKLEKLDCSSIGGYYKSTKPVLSPFIGVGAKEVYFLENSSLKVITGKINSTNDLLVLDLQHTQLESIKELAFSNNTKIHTIILPNTLKEICTYAFLNCEALSSIVIPSSVEKIDDYAFYDCSISVYFRANSLPLGLSPHWDLGVKEYFLGVSDVYTDGDFSFMDSDSGKTLIKYNGTLTNVDLSAYEIDFIGGDAFENTNIEMVILPSSLKGINKNAFAYSTIKEICIPSNVKYIDSYAFYNSTIESITFEGNSQLTKISKFAFAKCTELKSIVLPNSVSIIESYAFYHSGIEAIDFNNNVLLTEISDYVFAYTNLQTINIPENVTKIGVGAFSESSINFVNFNSVDLIISERAFYMADLLEVYIPSNIVFIGEYAFSGNVNLVGFEVDENNNYYSSHNGSLLNKNQTILICVPATITGHYNVLSTVEDIAKGAFEYSNITGINFANNNALYIINTRAFFNAEKLERIIIPSSVVYIDYYAFAYCKNLKEVIFEDDTQLQGIYEGAFYYCTSLESFDIPETVSEIGEYAFYACTSLKAFDFTNVEEIKSYAFAYSGLEEFVVENSKITYIHEFAFSNSALKNIKISELLDITIEKSIFSSCDKLEGLEIYFYNDYPISYYFGGTSYNDNPKYIPNSLKSIIINRSIEILPEGAFYGLSMLEFIDIPDECKIMTKNSFTNVNAYIELPNDISFSSNKINSGYLSRGSVIDKLIIDDNITSVGDIFAKIEGIKEIYFYGENIEIGKISSSSLEKLFFGNENYIKELYDIQIADATIVFDFSLPLYMNIENFYEIYNLINNGVNYLYLENGKYKYLDTVYYGDSFDKIKVLGSKINLENVYISNTVKTFDYFSFLINLENVYYDGTLEEWLQVSIGRESHNPMFYGNNFYYKDENDEWVKCVDLIIPESVKVIGDYQFVGFDCETINLNNVEQIGQYAFYNCDKVKELTITSKVNTMNYSSFGSMNSLETLNIFMKEHFDIGSYFAGTQSVVSNINIIGGEIIPYGSFYDFKNAKKMTICNSILRFDSLSLPSNNLVEVNYLGSIEKWFDVSLGTSVLANIKNILFNGIEPIEIVVPNGITRINDCQLYNFSKLEKIIMSDTVESIGYSAFAQCKNLKEIVFSKNIKTIDSYAFYQCSSLLRLTLPTGLESIGESAFGNCTSLVELIIPESVNYIGKYILGDCPSLKKLSIPFIENELSNYLNRPSYSTSSLQKLEELYITNSPVLPKTAFKHANISKLIVSNKTKDFSNSIQSISNLEILEYQGTVYDWLNCNGLHKYFNFDIRVTGEKITNLVIDDSLMEIGSRLNGNLDITKLTILTNKFDLEYSFSGCTNIKYLELINTDIKLPYSLMQQIEEVAVLSGNVTSEYFKQSFKSLKKVNLSSEVFEIGEYAFSLCPNLREVVIEEGLQKIGHSAFSNCTSLEKINLPSSLTNIGNSAFSNCTSLEKISLPSSITSIGDFVFSKCTSLEKINLPSSLTNIGNSAFYNCTSLTEINLPSQLTSIGYSAFSGCSSLQELYIPYVENMGSHVFENCILLTNVEFNDLVKIVNSYMFFGCSNLSQVNLNKVEIIDVRAFGQCVNLKEISFPSSIKNISTAAFEECSGLTKFIFEDGFEFNFESEVFNTIPTIKEAIIPISLTDNSFTISSFDTVYFNGDLLEYNNSTTSFKNVKHLYLNGELVTDLVFPEGVEGISNYYSSIVDLQTVTIPSTIRTLPSEIFKDCYSLHTVYNYTDSDYISSIISNSYSGKIIYSDGSVYGESYELIIDGLVFYFTSSTDSNPTLIRYIGDLESITLPDTVNNQKYSIAKFRNGTLKEVNIPGTVILDSKSFDGSTISDINLYDYDTRTMNVFSPLKDTLVEISFIRLQESRGLSFEGFTKLKNVSFIDSDEITELNASCFKDCISLENISLPENLTSLYQTFINCTSLKSIVITDNVTKINGAFEGCTLLEYVKLPDGLQEIGYRCFYGCTSLKSIDLPSSIVDITHNSFDYCTSIESIVIPSNVKKAPSLIGCSLKEVILQDGITDINLGGLCATIEKLYVPSTYCGQSKFSSSNFDYELYFDGNVYDWCQIDFETAENSLALNATNVYFKNDDNEWYLVEDLIIPSDVEVVKSYTFAFFDKVKSISFSTPTYFEKNSLYTKYGRDFSIETIYYTGVGNDFFTIALNAFDSSVSKNINSIYINNEPIDSLIIPEGTTNVDCEFFTNLKFIKNLYIPKSVVSVAGRSLALSELSKVSYGGTIESWGNIEFDSNSALPTYYSKNLYINDVVVEELNINTEVRFIDNYGDIHSIKMISNLGNITKIPRFFISANKNLETVNIPDSVTLIEEYAFYECSNLKNIITSQDSQLETIEENAFSSCGNLSYISLSNKLKSFHIGKNYDERVITEKVNFYGSSKEWMAIDFGERYIEFEEFYINNKIIETLEFDSSYKNSNGLQFINSIKCVVFPKEMMQWHWMGSNSLEKIYYNGTLEDWMLSTYNGGLLNDNTNFYYLDENGEYVRLSRNLVIPETVMYLNNHFGTMSFDSIEIHKNVQWLNGYLGNKSIKNVYFNGDIHEYINSSIINKISTNGHCNLHLNGKLINKLVVDESFEQYIGEIENRLRILNNYNFYLVYNESNLPISFDNLYEYGLKNMVILVDENGMFNEDGIPIVNENGFFYEYRERLIPYKLIYIDTEDEDVLLPKDAFGVRYEVNSLKYNSFNKIKIPEDYNFSIGGNLPAITLEFDNNIREIKDISYLDYKYLILPEEIDSIINCFKSGGYISKEILDLLLSKTKSIDNSFKNNSIDEITIFSNVKNITNSFSEIRDCKTLILEEGIEEIFNGFNNNYSESYLSTITLPNSLKALGVSFNGHTSLENITFGEESNIDTLNGVFQDAHALKHLSISEGVTIISDSFKNCYSLIDVEFPTSLETIDNYAFKNCTSLSKLQFYSKNCVIKESFNSCYALYEILANGDYNWNIDFTNTLFAQESSNYIDGGLYINNSLVHLNEQSIYLKVKKNAKISLYKSYSNIKYLEYEYLDATTKINRFITNKLETLKINDMKRGFGLTDSLNLVEGNIIIGEQISCIPDIRNTSSHKFFFEFDKQIVDLWGISYSKAYFKNEWIIVTFEDECGNVVSKGPQSKYEIIRIPYYVPSNDNYTNRWLNGWDYNNDKVVDPIPATSNEDVRFKAIVGLKQAVYYVTYYDKDGITPLYIDEYSYGDILALRDSISKKGYTFNGWDYTLVDNLICSDLSIYSNWTHIGEHDYSIVEKVEPT